MSSKTPSYDEAKDWTRKRLEETVKKGSFPKDVVAMSVLLREAHRGRELKEKTDQLKAILDERGSVKKSDWERIFSLTNNVIDV